MLIGWARLHWVGFPLQADFEKDLRNASLLSLHRIVSELKPIISSWRPRKSICSRVQSFGGKAKWFFHPKLYFFAAEKSLSGDDWCRRSPCDYKHVYKFRHPDRIYPRGSTHLSWVHAWTLSHCVIKWWELRDSLADFSQLWQGINQGERTKALICSFML